MMGDTRYLPRYKQLKLKHKSLKKIYHANSKYKGAGMANIVQYKVLNQKVTRNKEGHCMLIKRPMYQEDITIMNIYATITRPQNTSM